MTGNGRARFFVRVEATGQSPRRVVCTSVWLVHAVNALIMAVTS